MLKYLLAFCCCLGINVVKAQTESDLIGTWKVLDVIVNKDLPIAKNPQFAAQMKATMTKTQFTFRPDHHFILKMDIKNAQQVPEGLWSYDKEKKAVNVVEVGKPSGKLMYFTISKDASGNMFFKSPEIPVTLKVHQ